MASPSICFGYETALQILRTTDPRERTLLRSGAHTMPDRAPSMCAFRQALESLETLHPSMMLEQPVHLLVSRVSQCRSTSAFTVRACKTIVQGRPLHRLGNGAYVSAAPLAFVHIAAQETSMIALLELGYELCGSYQNQTNRHIIRLPGRTPVIDSRPCRLRHTKPVASRRNQSRENLALPCRQLGLPVTLLYVEDQSVVTTGSSFVKLRIIFIRQYQATILHFQPSSFCRSDVKTVCLH